MTIRFYNREEELRSKLRHFILNKVKPEHHRCMDDRIKEYVSSGVLIEIPMEQALFIASIAMIPREADATRPREILDFTKLNKYILDADCRLSSRGDLISLVNNYSFAASVDIKSCYTNIKLHPDYQAYCCIS